MSWFVNFCRDVIEHVFNNPAQTVKRIVKTAAIIVPTAVLAPIYPVLETLGSAVSGPVGGSLAAAFQSAVGTNAVFSVLQSAAMGGYGVTALAAGVQATAAVGAVTEVAQNLFGYGERQAGEALEEDSA